MSNKKFKILKIKDKSENYKRTDGLFIAPFKAILCGKSEKSGKTSILLNLLLRDIYGLKAIFKPENIYITSKTATTDYKMRLLIETLDIPEENVMTEYNEDYLNAIIENIKEEFDEAIDEGRKPEHNLFIFDDMGAQMRSAKFVDALFCVYRHLLCSTLILCQKYTQTNRCQRENLTQLITFKATLPQITQIMEDHLNHIGKKNFIKMYYEHTANNHDFIVINYDKPNLYLNSNFEEIELNKYLQE